VTLKADLSVAEKEFSMDNSLGIFSWEYDPVRKTGVTRMYQRVHGARFSAEVFTQG
jgi:hypothetical protein